MSIYQYEGRDRKGNIVKGTVEARNEAQAVEVLESHGLIPIRFRATSKFSSVDQIFAKFSGVSSKDLVIFFRQLATLVNAQIRIVKALRILTRQVSSPRFRSIIEEVASDVEGGSSLSDALRKYPKYFPDLYSSLIQAGEASGTLDKSMLYLADQVEKDHDLKSKVRGALMYPAFIIVMLLVVGGLMMVFVLPQMTGVLLEAGAQLPLTTRVIIATSNFMVGYWYIVIVLLVGLVVGFKFFIQSRDGRYLFDRALISAPLFGDFIRKIYIYRFAHHLSNLLSGGISINKALDLIAGAVGNYVYRDIFLDASSEIQTGRSLHDVLESYPQVPPLVSQMVAVGEETGDLPGILTKLSTFYDKEVDNGIANMTTLIEPIIMIILGLAVGIMVAGIILPVYNLASTF